LKDAFGYCGLWALSLHRVDHHLHLESGETMKAAGLKAIGTVMDTQAVLIKSKTPTNPNLVDIIVSRIRGVISMGLCSFFTVPSLTIDCPF